MSSNASIWQGQSQLIPVANSFGNVFEEWQIATAGQTLVIINSFQYTPGTFTLLVFKNGLFQRVGFDYLETNSSRITFTTPLALNDRVAFYAFATSGVAIPNGGGVPAGGAIGQVLTKISVNDYDSNWTSISALASLLDSVRQSVASAVTLDLTGAIATQTRNIQITGTVSITGFQIANGQLWAVKAGGAFTLVNSAAITTQTGGDIICGIGDTFFLRATADNVVEILCFARALASTLLGSSNCRLDTTGANLILQRANGNTMIINGAVVSIPAAGVQLAPTALAANTNYYIYAVATAGVVTSLEASVTAYTINATTGIPNKTGDATRALVGLARTTAGIAWANSLTQRYVISWFNRKQLACRISISASISTSAAGMTEIDATWRLNVLTWAGDNVHFGLSGAMSVNAIATCAVQIFINGAISAGPLDAWNSGTSSVAGYQLPIGATTEFPSSTDGFTFIGVNGMTAAGQMTVVGSGVGGVRSALSATIWG